MLRQTLEIASTGSDAAKAAGTMRSAATIDPEGERDDGGGAENLAGVDYAAIDALLDRSKCQAAVPSCG
jgi:hypothetical protein